MAQFISRQLQYAGLKTEWFHEAAIDHPLSVDHDGNMAAYKKEVSRIWREFVNKALLEDRILVFEACYLNNCLETLFIHNEPLDEIIKFSLLLEEILKPINPCLIYLFQPDVRKALEVNFNNRGNGFRKFVIDFCLDTPVSRMKNWQDEEGMFVFWEEFVKMTEKAFNVLQIKKLRIDNSDRRYDQYKKQVLAFLGLNQLEGPHSRKTLVKDICGDYLPVSGHKKEVSFRIYEENQKLMAGFLNYRSELIYRGGTSFDVAGWYFVFEFERSEGKDVDILNISGKDVDYLVLSGIRAEKIS